jgi:hypothetical protein
MRTHSIKAPSDPGRRGPATSSHPKPSLAARLAPAPIPTAALVVLLASLALAAPAPRASAAPVKAPANATPTTAMKAPVVGAAALAGLPEWKMPQQYSVDLVMTNGGQTMTMHRFIDGENIRSELEAQGEQLVMLERGAEQYQIIPSQKMVMKMAVPASAPAPEGKPAAQTMDARIERLGEETLDGVRALKYQVTSEGHTGTAWFDAATGAPLRMESAEARIEWKNLKPGPQPAKLYEVPKDFQVMDMAQIQSQIQGMGGPGGVGGAGIPTLPPGAAVPQGGNAMGAAGHKGIKGMLGGLTGRMPGGVSGAVPGGVSGGLAGGMPGGAGGGVSGMAQNAAGRMGQNFGEQLGSGVGASFGGPFGAIAGRYIGGRVGGWLGTHVAKAVTGGGGN